MSEHIKWMKQTNGNSRSWGPTLEAEILYCTSCKPTLHYNCDIFLHTQITGQLVTQRHSTVHVCDHSRHYIEIYHHKDDYKLAFTEQRPCVCPSETPRQTSKNTRQENNSTSDLTSQPMMKTITSNLSDVPKTRQNTNRNRLLGHLEIKAKIKIRKLTIANHRKLHKIMEMGPPPCCICAQRYHNGVRTVLVCQGR